jgi:hypothetical protein
MKADQFRAAMKALDYNETEIAQVLRVSARAVARWASGEREVPGPVAALLTLLKECPGARWWVRWRWQAPRPPDGGITGAKADAVFVDELHGGDVTTMVLPGVTSREHAERLGRKAQRR